MPTVPRALREPAADERGLVGTVVVQRIGADESQKLPADDNVDVFGEAVDQLPALGERRTTFECQVRTRRWQPEQGSERPAHPEVLLHAAGAEPESSAGLFVDDALALGQGS